MKLEVKTAKSTQSAIPEMGKTEKNLYYLTIGEDKEMVVINVGEKTYNSVKNLTDGKQKTYEGTKK